jgi:hypothetical protein
MKRFVMVLLASCVAMGAYAQFEKGTMMVGGSFGADFTTNKSKYDGNSYTNGKYVDVSFDPQFGIFVINNLAVGGGIGISTSSFKEDDTDFKSVTHEFTIQPMARYYLQPGIFFQGKLMFGGATDKDVENGETDKTEYAVNGWSLSAGYPIFLNNVVAIEPQLGYGGKGYRNKDTDVRSVDSGIFLRVGFQIYLRK